ncbi:MAG: low molecular weight protein-tyrosine-phosphatase [Burkholderiales bacterium]
MNERSKISVLFVCTGNICRSPTAEAVFKHCVREAGLAGRIVSDSAGTHDYHVGEPPDPRTQRAAKRRGYELGALRARRVRRDDFERFDYVLAMDEANLWQLERLCPREHAHKLKLFLDFGGGPPREVPDPYYGGPEGFERVLDLVEGAAQGLLRHLNRND